MQAREAARSRWSRLSVPAIALVLAVPVIFLGFVSPAAADEPKVQAHERLIEFSEDKVGTARVPIGKSRTLRTSSGFVDLVVGDSEIADVMPLSDHSLYILGKKIGTTNVSVFDTNKHLVGLIEVEITYDTPRLANDIERAAPGDGAKVLSANGRTVLSGSVGDAVGASDAAVLAKAYGPEFINDIRVRGPQQVMLEVRFIEASRDASKELGVNWKGVGKNFQDPVRGAMNFSATTGTGALITGQPFGAIIGRVLSNGVQADVLVQALEEKGLARRLAEPNLITLSGEKASFLAGGEFPIPIAADAFGRITVDYKKFGVGLTFTPTVLRDNVINLRIEPEVSQLDFTNKVSTGGGITIPALIVRRASTVIELRDGQSFAIAGLLQNINTETRQQLPWLADVPILGTIFASTSFERKETDLAIIVTAHLVRPARPGERLKTPVDNVAAANDADRFLTGQQEVSVDKARKAGTVPLPPSGHFLDIPKASAYASH